MANKASRNTGMIYSYSGKKNPVPKKAKSVKRIDKKISISRIMEVAFDVMDDNSIRVSVLRSKELYHSSRLNPETYYAKINKNKSIYYVNEYGDKLISTIADEIEFEIIRLFKANSLV